MKNKRINIQKALHAVIMITFFYPIMIVAVCLTATLITHPLNDMIIDFYAYFQDMFYYAKPGMAKLNICATHFTETANNVKNMPVACTNFKTQDVPMTEIIKATRQIIIGCYFMLWIPACVLYFVWPKLIAILVNRYFPSENKTSS